MTATMSTARDKPVGMKVGSGVTPVAGDIPPKDHFKAQGVRYEESDHRKRNVYLRSALARNTDGKCKGNQSFIKKAFRLNWFLVIYATLYMHTFSIGSR